MSNWRPVVGYEGYYVISDVGEVKRVHQGKGARAGHVLKPMPNECGYPVVALCVDGRSRRFLVHRLVAFAFLGAPPSPGLEVCHNNGNQVDARATNLRWDTPHENGLDTVRHGHHWQANKSKCPKGHPYDSTNTYIIPSTGGRMCRICKRTHHQARSKKGAFDA